MAINFIPAGVHVGAQVYLKAFGIGHIRKIYVHSDTHEMCCEVKARTGECLHLSFKYLGRVL